MKTRRKRDKRTFEGFLRFKNIPYRLENGSYIIFLEEGQYNVAIDENNRIIIEETGEDLMAMWYRLNGESNSNLYKKGWIN